MASAWLYDGESALRHDVQVSRGERTVIVTHADGTATEIGVGKLVHVETRGGTEVYGRTDKQGWRLGVTDAEGELAAILPGKERYGRLIDRVGLVPALAIGALLSGAVLFAGNQAPEWIAPAVPKEWEQRFGDNLVGDFGGKGCRRPEGEAALRKLAAQLSPNARDLNIRVVDIRLVNAAALPGGNIVIFRNLLTEAESPDEVAGVLAHEIAHVEERHTTESMIRAFGLGLIVSALGGSTGANVESLVAAGHSRSAEREADAKAMASLQRANISPIATARFFERLGRAEKAFGRVAVGLSYLSTHPLSEERQRAFRASAIPGRRYMPALTQAEWDALQDICWQGPVETRPVPPRA